MSEQVTVTLPEDLLQLAQVCAEQIGRPLEDFLAETIELSLLPLGKVARPAGEWTNEEVIAALEFELTTVDDQRLTQLLQQQREARVTEEERIELRRLMALYQERLLHKAVALREATKRGLRPSPSP